jgi:flagellar hook-associated protein 1 FlgK
MVNLISSMMSASGSLDAYSSALDVVQNNVVNASTPGYANQTESMDAMAFDPSLGLTGGVLAGQVVSSRNAYAEQSVQQQTSLLGQAQQDVSSLTSMQSLFDVTGTSGITTAFNNLFQAFSAWGQTPTSTVAQQNVLEQATAVAAAFNQTATGLSEVAGNTQQQLQQTVGDINQLTGQLASYNQTIMNGDHNDAGLDAQIHSTLEQLSQYGTINATEQNDGTYTVLLNGQTPLVIESQAYNLQTEPTPNSLTSTNPLAPAHQSILGSDGTDITATISGGQLGSLLNTANNVLPTYLGDENQAGTLNTLATQFANNVNTILTQGYQTDGSDGSAPVAGVPLFTYDTTNATNAAQSLQVSSTITPDQLGAIDLGPPEVSNGVPLALSQLANPTDPSDEINGLSYTQYYGNIAADIGSKLNNANDQLQTQQSAVAQAQNVRQQISGVSLDQEAVLLVQYQRAYEASSKLISVLDQLTLDTLNMMTPAT